MAGAGGATAVGTTVGVNGGIGKTLRVQAQFFEKRAPVKKPALFLFLRTSQLRETAEMAQDWWGEAPDLPLRTSKAAEVVESVVRRAGKPPSRGPARGIRQTVGDGRSNGKPVQLKALDDGGAVGPARQRFDPKHKIVLQCPIPWQVAKAVPEPRTTQPWAL
jgi:hypothetical protein